MTTQKLSNLPPKGTYDWLPGEFAVRKYIFDTWRKVCRSFGYEEYLTPLVESADIYRAKSGADIGGTELTTFMDRGDRELAIRPEMTPSVTRMVSRIYEGTVKPIRLFSIANFYRNERPQRGRNREFWQLNCDIFGVESTVADLEILQLALEIMLSFSPPKDSFTLFINNRKLIDAVLPQTSNKTDIVRLLDKAEKLSPTDLSAQLDLLDLSSSQKDLLINFINSSSATQLIKNIPSLKNNPGYLECVELMSRLEKLGYGEWVKFKPNVIRGFDYYDGMVFEVFDNNPQNLRSMFGGGRYNGLASIFGGSSFPATGFAPGDETTKLFLESWNLLPTQKSLSTQVLVTIFSPDLLDKSLELSTSLRKAGVATEIYPDTETKLDRQLKYASTKGIPYVAIIGPEEVTKNEVKVKNMTTGEQQVLTSSDLIKLLSS